MQAKRKTLDYLYNNVAKEFNLLLKLSGMPSSTFYRNFKILQEGGSLKIFSKSDGLGSTFLQWFLLKNY